MRLKKLKHLFKLGFIIDKGDNKMLDDFLINESYDAWEADYEEYLELLQEATESEPVS